MIPIRELHVGLRNYHLNLSIDQLWIRCKPAPITNFCNKCKLILNYFFQFHCEFYFRASNGSLQHAIFKCFKLNELVKNCLYDGGISLPFLVLNELCETFKYDKCVPQPRRSAPNNC